MRGMPKDAVNSGVRTGHPASLGANCDPTARFSPFGFFVSLPKKASDYYSGGHSWYIASQGLQISGMSTLSMPLIREPL